MSVETISTRVVTPVARLSYPALFTPAKGMDGAEGKYQCELIFEPGEDLSKLKAAAKEAARTKWGDKIPANLRSPFREGDVDRSEKDGYEGRIFIGARSKDRPGVVVGGGLEDCVDPREVYGGCYVRASVTAFAYDRSGNRGIAFALNNIQKLGEGTRLDNRRAASDEFEADLNEEPASLGDLL